MSISGWEYKYIFILKAGALLKKNEKKPFYKNWWFWLTTIGAVFGVPMIINALYIKNKGYMTAWSGEDVLAYYGSLLGATATIIAVVLTIKFTVNNQKEERKVSVKPYLQTKYQLLSSYSAGQFDNVDLFIQYKKGLIETARELPTWLQKIEILNHKSSEYNDISGRLSIKREIEEINKRYFKNNYIIDYRIKNYGSNTAIDVGLYLNGMCLLPKFCIGTNDEKQFVIMMSEDDNETLLSIVLEYFDVYSIGKYQQKESFLLRKYGEELQVVQFKENLLTSPEEVTEV